MNFLVHGMVLLVLEQTQFKAVMGLKWAQSTVTAVRLDGVGMHLHKIHNFCCFKYYEFDSLVIKFLDIDYEFDGLRSGKGH